MSDDVFTIATPFGDVAELGQGYVNRADGERILLPLPSEAAPGEGVRFIVQLADGTPAFAGAGRCVQASDQGSTVEPAERFETLLDNLAFDDRSRPVYDYIVAVRQAVYAAGGPEAQAEADAVAEVEAASAAEPGDDEATEFVDSMAAQASEVAGAEVLEAEPEVPVAEPVAASLPPTSAPAQELLMEPSAPPDALAAEGDFVASTEPEAGAELEAAAEPEPATYAHVASDAPEAHWEEPAPAQAVAASEPAPAVVAASIPAPSIPAPEYVVAAAEPLPTGMLKRPAIAGHWQPAPGRPPRPSRGTGLFRHAAGALPVPGAPPRPQLDPSQWVRPAPSPNS
ncbi:MAG TPA: hypothetical protein VF331_00290 [Polyangiales bacterium]